jgi:hypothetical protein
MNSTPRFTTVFVLGIAHSGSTILGRVLDMHPDVVCVGELLRLSEGLENPAEQCSCGAALRECSFWMRLINQVPEEVKKNYKKWDLPLLNKVRLGENGRLLIDLSKTRAHRLTKRWHDQSVGYILMLRDPRGVLRTTVERGEDLAGPLKVHRKWIGRLTEFADENASRCLTMHYEDLVTNPEARVKEICTFLNLTFVPEMLTPDAKLHHFVSSNASTYIRTTTRFQLDERWRRELKPEQIALISNYLKSVPVYRTRYELDAAPT